jgi:hypothetical protein
VPLLERKRSWLRWGSTQQRLGGAARPRPRSPHRDGERVFAERPSLHSRSNIATARTAPKRPRTRTERDPVSAVIRRRPDDLIDPRSRDIHRLGPASTDRPRKARYMRAARTALATGGQAQPRMPASATGSRTPCQRGHNDDVRFVRPGTFAGDAAPHAGGSMATASIEMSRGQPRSIRRRD